MLQREVSIAINGFGRIGRALMRVLRNHPAIKVVLINDPMPVEQGAYLLKYDSVMNRYFGEISAKNCEGEDTLNVLGQQIRFTHHTSLREYDFKKAGVDFVINSSGLRESRQAFQDYLNNGAKRVFISAPAPGVADRHVIMGVNNMDLTSADRIISGGSCTAACFAPIIEALSSEYTVLRGFMQTIHSYTSAQNLMDGPHPTDMRRGRAAGANIVPTTTESIVAFEAALPQYVGLLKGMAMRVPVTCGSNIDLVLQLERELSRAEVNDFIKLYAEMRLRKIVEYCEDPIVSSDIVGNPHSCVFDSLLTEVHGPLVRLFLWYDNEWGYTNRFVELLELATYLR